MTSTHSKKNSQNNHNKNASLCFEKGEFEEALNLWEKVLKSGNNDSVTLKMAAVAWHQLHDEKRTLNYIRKVSKEGQKNRRCQWFLKSLLSELCSLIEKYGALSMKEAAFSIFRVLSDNNLLFSLNDVALDEIYSKALPSPSIQILRRRLRTLREKAFRLAEKDSTFGKILKSARDQFSGSKSQASEPNDNKSNNDNSDDENFNDHNCDDDYDNNSLKDKTCRDKGNDYEDDDGENGYYEDDDGENDYYEDDDSENDYYEDDDYDNNYEAEDTSVILAQMEKEIQLLEWMERTILEKELKWVRRIKILEYLEFYNNRKVVLTFEELLSTVEPILDKFTEYEDGAISEVKDFIGSFLPTSIRDKVCNNEYLDVVRLENDLERKLMYFLRQTYN